MVRLIFALIPSGLTGHAATDDATPAHNILISLANSDRLGLPRPDSGPGVSVTVGEQLDQKCKTRRVRAGRIPAKPERNVSGKPILSHRPRFCNPFVATPLLCLSAGLCPAVHTNRWRESLRRFGTLPGLEGPRTYAPSPVWSGSTTATVKFQPVSMKEARRLYRRAEDFERQTRQPGRQDGALGRNGLKVIEALLFGFLNYRTGQLDPAYEAIARKACMSVRSVARGLKNLYQAGVLHWQRRCRPVVDEAGRCTLEQDTNAYGVRPPSQWQGYTAPAEAPAPDPETWGAAPVIERGTVEAGTFDRAYELIELDAQAAAGNALAAVLARGNEISGFDR